MIRVGTSGWRYRSWRAAFYPSGLPQRGELSYLARQLNSVELNGSFYSLQRPARYQAWVEETPDDFVFAVKGSRFITHMKRLRSVETPLANFFASGVLAFGEKLGPVLWQLPPSLAYDADLLTAFFALLPSTTGAAAELASRHDHRLDGRALTSTAVDRPLRHAIEVRHDSFTDDGVLEVLRAHDIALVTADTAGRFPFVDAVTADFSYLRLHGDTELYRSGYSDEALDRWAEVIRDRPAGHDVYVYFDNDADAHAPTDAIGLARRLRLSPVGRDHRSG